MDACCTRDDTYTIKPMYMSKAELSNFFYYCWKNQRKNVDLHVISTNVTEFLSTELSKWMLSAMVLVGIFVVLKWRKIWNLVSDIIRTNECLSVFFFVEYRSGFLNSWCSFMSWQVRYVQRDCCFWWRLLFQCICQWVKRINFIFHVLWNNWKWECEWMLLLINFYTGYIYTLHNTLSLYQLIHHLLNFHLFLYVLTLLLLWYSNLQFPVLLIKLCL